MKKLSLSKTILDIILPIECLGCAKENIWLCAECFKKIRLIKKDKCLVCKKVSEFGKTHPWCTDKTNLDGVIIAARYGDKLLSDVIYKYKYNFIKKLASPLSEILINKIIELDKQEGKPNWVSLLFGHNLIVVPVPLHKRRLRWRDFNQAELLAKNLARKFYLDLKPYILERKKYTQTQIELKRNKRLKNIQGAFRINKEWQGQPHTKSTLLRGKLKNTKILLVDDVTTTGSTLNECARILKESGALEVWGIVLARG